MKNYTKIFFFITYKTLIGNKPLRVRFDKGNWFIRIYDGTRYLVLFGAEKYDFIYNSIRYLIGEKSVITYVISHNYAKIKSDLYNPLPLEKTLIFRDVIILIKKVLTKNQNHYYYNIFLEKCSYQLPINNGKNYVFV